ncbi:MAG: hypothetical protein IPM92_12865 [Saprospiraceae bacterium]|nr:hypothetical protein [Saprospiraceae bacterium]
MNTIQKIEIGLWMLLSLQLFSCKGEKDENTPDVKHIQTELKLYRFEKELEKLDSSALAIDIKKLCSTHPAFCNLYFNSILQMPFQMDQTDPEFGLQLKMFLYHPSNIRLSAKLKLAIPEDEILHKSLELSLRYFKYYFPETREPVFYTAFCDFSYGNFIFEHESGADGLGIGLEFFAGEHIDYKTIDPENPVFSDYIKRSLNADHLLPRTWDAWLEDRIQVPASSQLLDFIIQRGKKLYILKTLLPHVADTAVFDMSVDQLQWCRNNKMEIWSFFLAQKLLYSSELMKINKYVNPSPNSPGMPENAPGRTGSYIGYELVKAYMKNNPDTRLVDLLETDDSQSFLQKSRFKPRNE